MISKHVALLALVACASRKPGVRDGVAVEDGDPTLARLEVNVSATQRLDEPVEVLIGLSDPDAKRDACFVATSADRVLVDGQPTTLQYAGGAAGPTHVSGVAFQFTECSPAQFHWRGSALAAPTARTQIIVEHAGKRAEVVIAQLTTPRALRVSPSTQLRPGDQVTLEWSPRDDEWSGYPSNPEVHIYQPDDFAVHVPVKVKLPRFHFTMPAVRPGPARLDLSHLYLDAHPVIRDCRGVRRCTASANTGPRTVELVVLSK